MGIARYRCAVVGCISVILFCFFYICELKYEDVRDIAFKQHQTKTDTHYTDDPTGTMKAWNDRVTHLQKGCDRTDLIDKYKIKYWQGRAIFFQSTKLNVSICKVAKAGSTFWAIVLLIVDKGIPATKAFGISRSKIHGISNELTISLSPNHQSLGTKGVVVSRDPYSRLFSAFIDKFYLLRFASSAKSLARSLGKGLFITDAGECGYDISFQDFVESVTTNALQGRSINRHWCPVYTLCRVCDVDYNYVIKQETLTRDTENIIDKLNISREMKTTLTTMFHGSGTNKTMEGVIETMWQAIDRNVMQQCCSNKLAYFMKMWEAFKIQGYIRTNISFPLSSFQEKGDVNVDEFIKAVLTAMYTNPLSSVERKDQRRQALVKAYADIPRRIIAQIQEMFKMDFHMFDYDVNPPT